MPPLLEKVLSDALVVNETRAVEVFSAELAAGATPTQSLADYVTGAALVCRDQNIGREYGDPWRSTMYEFTRHMKDHPHLTNLGAVSAFRLIESAADVDWSERFDFGRDDAQAEFVKVWGYSVVSPRGGPLTSSDRLAKCSPLKVPDEIMAERPDNYARFVSLAGWLQIVRGNSPFLIIGTKFGEKLGVSDRTVSTYVEWAHQDGFIKRTKPYAHTSKGDGRNSGAEYVFDVNRFPELLERAAPGTAELFAHSAHVPNEPRRTKSRATSPATATASALPESEVPF
jgi:hypothetical protein